MKHVVLSSLLALSLASTAQAAVISGSIYNVDGDNDGLVDDLKIAQIQFDVTAGTTVFFDSLVWEATGVDLNGDGYLTGFDAQLSLFDGVTRIAYNDDSWSTYGDGSVHHYDSTISWTFADAGTYLITLGQLYHHESQALQGYMADVGFYDYQGNDDSFGAWQLTMTVTDGVLSNLFEVNGAAVPVPATLGLLGLGLLAVGASRRRR